MEAVPHAVHWSNRKLFRLIWPLIIEQFFAISIGMIDTAMVSAVGENAVSGVSLVDSINLLLINLLASFATGGAVIVSQYIGQKDAHQAGKAAKQLVYGITALSVLLSCIIVIMGEPLLRLIFGNIEPEVMAAAKTYFFYSSLGYPFLALYNACAALFRSMGNSRISMITAILVNILNAAGNAILIFGLQLGVAGAAIATLISRAAAALLLLWLLIRKRSAMQPISLTGLHRVSIDFSMIRRILKIGIPNGLENSMFQIGKLLVAKIVSQFGTAAIAGNGITSILANFNNIPASAIGLALLTVVGQSVGAGDHQGARRQTRKLLLTAHIIAALFSGFILLFSEPLVSMFGLSDEATGIAIICLRVHCVFSALIWPESFALPSALRASGDVSYTMVISVGSMWVFRIGFSYILAVGFNLGVLGIWSAMVVDWFVRSVFFILRWKSGKWMQKKVIH